MEPSFTKVTNDGMARATPEQLETWKREAAECDAVSRAAYDEGKRAMDRLVALAKDAFGSKSRVPNYIDARRHESLYHRQGTGRWAATLETRLRDIAEQRKRDEARAAEKAKDAAAQTLIAEATLWLTAKGKVLGVDFTGAGAVERADEIAFSEEVDRMRAAGGPFSFSGEDYCESCDGWDGESHRCNCGNRRVSWTTGYGHSFKAPYVVAEAN